MNRSEETTRSYLDALRKSGVERVRLTEQLMSLVSATLDEIAQSAELGVSVAVEGISATLVCRKLDSSLGEWLTIVAEPSEGERQGIDHFFVFSTDEEPDKSYYFMQDPGRELRNAPRSLWLEVANKLPQIAAAFQTENEKVSAALRERFEVLKQMAGKRD